MNYRWEYSTEAEKYLYVDDVWSGFVSRAPEALEQWRAVYVFGPTFPERRRVGLAADMDSACLILLSYVMEHRR